jgi:hypothetical protein
MRAACEYYFIVDVAVEITADHKGWFEFRICPNNNPTVPATEECMNRNLLAFTDGSTRYSLDFKTIAIFVLILYYALLVNVNKYSRKRRKSTRFRLMLYTGGVILYTQMILYMPGWANCISGAACRRFIELFHQVLLVL